MKKFICTAVALLMGITPVFAAELTAKYDPNTGLYVISGSAPEADYNGLVSITVINDEEDTIGWASTLRTNDSDSFGDSFDFYEEAPGGYYTVSAGVYGKGVVKTAPLFYVTPTQKSIALKAVNDALIIEDEDDAKAALDKAVLDYYLYLGVDKDMYTSLGSAKGDVLAALLEEDSYTLIDDFVVDLETATAYALIKNADDTTITKIMEQYTSYFNLSSSELYDEFAKLAKDDVYAKMAGADCETPEEVLELFEASVALTIINNTSQWSDFKTALGTYIAYTGIDTTYYDKCDKGDLASAICDDDYDSSEELYDAIKSYYDGLGTGSGTTPSKKKDKGGSKGYGTITLLPEEPQALYSDMASFSWAEPAVTALSERGIISGDGTGRFNPADNVTREQFVKMLLLAFGLYTDGEESSFADVDADNWAYPYISCAFSKGIVKGIDDTNFGYGSKITRQDASVLIARAAELTGVELAAVNKGELTDMDTVYDYAKDSVLSMAQAGIINGYEDGSFRPLNNASRAEAAVMLYRLLNK
ncbi:MAG: S-layer homology domain-containing protein [Clostridia bacterium]|nr:S-layer homology domain-containing protein [Clostridia bacterium]